MNINFAVLVDYFVNRFIIPFLSAFVGFIIRNINVTIKRTGRFGKIKTAIASAFLIAIIAGAVLQYVQFDISIVICLSVLAGTCGAELLNIITKPSVVKLIFIAIFKKVGKSADIANEILTNVDKLDDDKIDTKKTLSIEQKEETNENPKEPEDNQDDTS